MKVDLKRLKRIMKRILTSETVRGKLTRESIFLFAILTGIVAYFIFNQRLSERRAESEGILNSVEAVLERDSDTLLLQFLFAAQGDLDFYLKNLREQFPRVKLCAASANKFSVPGACNTKANERQIDFDANPTYSVGFSVEPASILITVWQTVQTPTLWLMPFAALLFSLFVNLRLRSLFSQPLRSLKDQLGRMARGDRTPEAITKKNVREWTELTESLRALVRYIAELEAVSLKVGRTELARQVARDIQRPVTQMSSALADAPAKMKDSLAQEVARIRELGEELLRSTENSALEKDIQIEKEKLKTCNVVDLVKKMVDEKRMEFREKAQIKIFLEIFPGCDSLKVSVDPAAFTRSLSNVINNGVEAMIRGGRVRVKMRPINRESVVIQVSDEGIGIDPKILDQVTDRGFTYGKPQGAGLGLSFAKSAIEQFQGELRIESRKGSGTVVSFTLPTLQERLGSRIDSPTV